MPPKKKKDATATRKVVTNLPEQLDYNPFDLDNRALRELFAAIHSETKEAVIKLQGQNTMGRSDDVVSKLKGIIGWTDDFAQSLDKSRTVGHRFQCIERDVREH